MPHCEDFFAYFYLILLYYYKYCAKLNFFKKILWFLLGRFLSLPVFQHFFKFLRFEVIVVVIDSFVFPSQFLFL